MDSAPGTQKRPAGAPQLVQPRVPVCQESEGRFLLKKHSVRTEFLETKIHRSVFRSCPMNDASGNRRNLPRPDLQSRSVLHLNDEFAFDDQEQLVRRRMKVPRVVAPNYCQPKTMPVYAVDDRIAEVTRHRGGECLEIDDLKVGEPHWFVRIRFGRNPRTIQSTFSLRWAT